MTCDSTLLYGCHPPSKSLTIHTTDDTSPPVIIIGSISTKSMSLSTMLCVLKLFVNLISVSQLTSSGYLVSFTSTSCSVHDTCTLKQIGTGHRSEGLYSLHSLHLSSQTSSFAALASTVASFSLWHSRLGHLSLNKLKNLHFAGSLGNISVTSILGCLSRRLGKHHLYHIKVLLLPMLHLN